MSRRLISTKNIEHNVKSHIKKQNKSFEVVLNLEASVLNINRNTAKISDVDVVRIFSHMAFWSIVQEHGRVR